MGAHFTRENHRVENIEISATSDYYYPPKNGNYFADHFIMGGEKFKATNPECFLFGENTDLSYLCNKPCQFPYKPPVGEEPSRSLRTLIHLRKDSLKLTRVPGSKENASQKYSLECTLDCDVQCSVQVFLFASENLSCEDSQYVSRNPEWISEVYSLPKGTNQSFSSGNFHIDFDKLNSDEFEFAPGAPEIPVVIKLSVLDKDFLGQLEVTFATFEKVSDRSFAIKPLKQKIVIDGLCYVIQEIYGIENKQDDSLDDKDVDHDDELENGSECVICMCEMRDTLILPCRHLCLCNTCANSLRFQSSTCPICRSAFYALLQIKAVKKKTALKGHTSSNEEASTRTEYEEVPLIEALNGQLVRSNGDTLRRAASARRSAGKAGNHRPGSRSAKSAASRSNSRGGASDTKHDRSHSRTSMKEKSRDDRTAPKASKSDALSCPNLRETALLMSANTSTDESEGSAPTFRSKSTCPKVYTGDYAERKGDTGVDCDSHDEADGLEESITLGDDIVVAPEPVVVTEEPASVVPDTPPSPPLEKNVPALEENAKDEDDSNVEKEVPNKEYIAPVNYPGSRIVVPDELNSSGGHISIPIDPDLSSLPGTPMGSDDSSRSVSSISFHHLPLAVTNPIYNAAPLALVDPVPPADEVV